jgi:translation initiation factor 1 (eIF-1/SUI1)
MLKTKKKEDVPRLISISRAPRGKKKSVTVVTGLSTFGKSLNRCYNRKNEWIFNDYKCVNFTDIDLKIAAKFFGSKFACGSSVTGDDEIVIQGDVKDDLFEVIPEKWPQVSFVIK